METDTAGRVLTEARIENLADVYVADRGLMPSDQIRSVTVPDALVDTGATMLSLPISLIRRLGLKQVETKRVRSSTGVAEVGLYQAVRLTIMDRSCPVDVLEVPDGTPALIGQLPLERLDFVVDMRNHALIGNPDHGGEHIIELY